MESLRERIIKIILYEKPEKKIAVEQMNKPDLNFQAFKKELIKNNVVSEDELMVILSKECKLTYLDLDKINIPTDNKNLLAKEKAFRYRVVPIAKAEGVLTLATADPQDIVAWDDLKLTVSFERIDFVLVKEESLNRALNSLYSEEKPHQAFFQEDDKAVKEITASEGVGLENIVSESKLPPIVRVVDLIVYQALKRRASDIHIEPTEKDLTIRYRIDGVLHEELNLPKRNQSAIMARLKIMSGLNITEFRIPQDGRFKVKLEGREIDFRVSSLPTNFGEKIVMRILDRESLSIGLKNLGFSQRPLEIFEEALRVPFGIILVTGPTGSGKSTTLYSIINQINTPEKNIITIEDPVEYQIEGITQIPVRPEIGLKFASVLRSVLRQSPDIIMVGEIRDSETADIAIKASLTGEFIFSTLHTNNSVGAITRLVDMGIEPFLVASSMIATTAQRLVRKLCPKCKHKEKVDKKLLEKFGFPDLNVTELYRPQGCSNCNNKGYRGRVALLEILSIDDTIKEMIVKRASEDEITVYAKKRREFHTLKEDGFLKCIDGITTIEEVLRVAG
jgi:type IV pilus assembly protein PilB